MVETAGYAALTLGCVLLLVLLWGREARSHSARRPVRVSAALMGLWLLALGTLVWWIADPWMAFAWRRTVQYGLVVLCLATVEVAGAFAARPRHPAWRAAHVIPIAIALASDLYPQALRSVLAAAVPARADSIDPAALVLFAAWLVFTTAAWWTGAAALRRAEGVQHRNRIRHLLLALACLLVGDLALWGSTVGTAMWSRPGASLGGLSLRLAGLALLTFVIVSHRLPDVRRLFLRGVRSGLLSGLTLALLTLGVILTGAANGSWEAGVAQARSLAPAVIVVSMVLVLFLPRLRRALDRTLFGGEDELQRALRRHSQRVSPIMDPNRLADATLDWAENALQVNRSAFILLTGHEGDGVECRIASARSVPALPPIVLPAGSRFLGHFRDTGRPLSQYDLDVLERFRELPDDERRWLGRLGVDVFVPVLVANRPVAVLALGAKGGKQAFTDQELETLLILAGQTGTALDNARLMDDLRHVQEDLEHLGSRLDATNQQLRQMDQAKSDFVAIAAHELRTPLSQIYGYSDVLTNLQDLELSNARVVHQFIDGISRGAVRLKRVVDAMIDMSLIETGSLILQPVWVPVSLLVKHAVESARATAGQRQVSLHIQDLSRLPYVEVDSVRLEQALAGLVSNAVKFTPDGGEITISAQTVTPLAEQEQVELRIRDTGIGIDPDKHELIFDKFYRGEDLLLHSSSEARFKGAGPGLGLAIAKGIIEAHGGRIWVESPGRDEENCPGSTFYVRLPVRRRKDD